MSRAGRSGEPDGDQTGVIGVRVVLIGAPGSGKGTQGEELSRRTGALHIASGDLLRAEVQADTELGREVSGYLDSGTLVPDRVLLDLTIPIAREAARGRGYILDGFPRSDAQAMQFDHLAGEQARIRSVVFLDVPRAELVARLLRRAAEQGRSDDNEEVILQRLRVFDEQTSPLIALYRSAGLLRVVNGADSPHEVSEAVFAAVADESADDLTPER